MFHVVCPHRTSHPAVICCSTKILFLLKKWTRMTLFRADWSKDLFYLLFEKWAHIFCSVLIGWMLAQELVMRVLDLFRLFRRQFKHRGLPHRLSAVMPQTYSVMLQINVLCCSFIICCVNNNIVVSTFRNKNYFVFKILNLVCPKRQVCPRSTV